MFWGRGGYPIQQMGGTPILPDGGYPHPSQDGRVPPTHDWMGYPPSGDRAATQRAVCLLLSRRRTFLFLSLEFSGNFLI